MYLLFYPHNKRIFQKIETLLPHNTVVLMPHNQGGYFTALAQPARDMLARYGAVVRNARIVGPLVDLSPMDKDSLCVVRVALDWPFSEGTGFLTPFANLKDEEGFIETLLREWNFARVQSMRRHQASLAGDGQPGALTAGDDSRRRRTEGALTAGDDGQQGATGALTAGDDGQPGAHEMDVAMASGSQEEPVVPVLAQQLAATPPAVPQWATSSGPTLLQKDEWFIFSGGSWPRLISGRIRGQTQMDGKNVVGKVVNFTKWGVYVVHFYEYSAGGTGEAAGKRARVPFALNESLDSEKLDSQIRTVFEPTVMGDCKALGGGSQFGAIGNAGFML